MINFGALTNHQGGLEQRKRGKETKMSEVKVELPSNLNLSEAQQKQLQEKFKNHLVEVLSGGKGAATVPHAKIDVVAKVKNEVV